MRDVPLSEQIPELTAHDNEPLDWPPDAVNVSDEPVVKDVELVIDSPLCWALPVVMEVFDDERSK